MFLAILSVLNSRDFAERAFLPVREPTLSKKVEAQF